MEKGPCGINFNLKNEFNYFLRTAKETRSVGKAVREVLSDLRSLFNEKRNPESAYFSFEYRLGVDKEGVPVLTTPNGVVVKDLLDNFVVSQNTDEGKEVAEEQRKQWLGIEAIALSLSSAQEVYFLSPRARKVEEGVALQKIRREGNTFLTEIRLIPEITEREAGRLLTTFVISGRQKRNLQEGNFSPLFQVVIGNKEGTIDFKTELPAIIDRVKSPTPLFRYTEPQLTLPRQVFPKIREVNLPFASQGPPQRQNFLESTFLLSPFFLPKPVNKNNLLPESVIGFFSRDQLTIKPSSFLNSDSMVLSEKREKKPQFMEVFNPPKIPESGVIFETKKEDEKPALIAMEYSRRVEISESVKRELFNKRDTLKREAKFVRPFEVIRDRSFFLEMNRLRKLRKVGSFQIGNYGVLRPLRERFFPQRRGRGIVKFKGVHLPKRGGLLREVFLEFVSLPGGVIKKRYSRNQRITEQIKAIPIVASSELKVKRLGRKPQNGRLIENFNIETSLTSQLQQLPIVIVEGPELLPPFVKEQQIKRKEITIAKMVLPENEVKPKLRDYPLKLPGPELLCPNLTDYKPAREIGHVLNFTENSPQSLSDSEFDWSNFFFLVNLFLTVEKIPSIRRTDGVVKNILSGSTRRICILQGGSLLRERISKIEVLEKIEALKKQPSGLLRTPFFNPLPLWFEVEPESEVRKIGRALDNKFSQQSNYFILILFYLWLMTIFTQGNHLILDSDGYEDIYKNFPLAIFNGGDSFCLLPEISN